MERVVNECSLEVAGIAGVNTYMCNTSPSRLAMLSSHTGQTLTMPNSTVNRHVTGIHRELAKYTHDIRFPCNAIIIKIIRKYPRTLGGERVFDNPITTIIYEDTDHPRREMGVLHLEKYFCMHQYFGFDYVQLPICNELVDNMYIPKDTVIAIPPNVSPTGDYKMGISAYVAALSMPCVIEDGVRVSDEFCERTRTKGYGRRTLSLSRETIPLNLHGDFSNYKIVPDIGERVGKNGLLFATRKLRGKHTPALLSRKALRKLDFNDKTIYAMPNAKVIDIIVYKGCRDKSNLPKGMDDQCQYYYKRTCEYYQRIIDEYKRIMRERGSVSINGELQSLLVDAQAYIHVPEKRHIISQLSRQEISEWIIEVIFEYDIIPGIGFKFTGMHGNKSIVVDIVPKNQMPKDAKGNHADIVRDSFSIIKRMNIGSCDEPYINASAEALQDSVRLGLNNPYPDINGLFNLILGWYEIVAPLHYDALLECVRMGITTAEEEVKTFAKDGHHSYMPPDNPVDYIEVVDELSRRYPPVFGPVTYTGYNGEQITTVNDVLIGEEYILQLGKIGNTWNAVSSCKLQHYGIPAKITNVDKYSSPVREGATRIWGESEIRLGGSVTGGDTMADIMDQSTNPFVHRKITENIFLADKPTDINEVIDRNIYPIGNGRVITMVKHVLECSGKEFAKYDEGQDAKLYCA